MKHKKIRLIEEKENLPQFLKSDFRSLAYTEVTSVAERAKIRFGTDEKDEAAANNDQIGAVSSPGYCRSYYKQYYIHIDN